MLVLDLTRVVVAVEPLSSISGVPEIKVHGDTDKPPAGPRKGI